MNKGDLVQVYLGENRGTYALWDDSDSVNLMFCVLQGDMGILMENVIPLSDYPGEEQVEVYFQRKKLKAIVPVEILKILNAA